MISHIRKLVQYCEEQWVAKAGTHRTHALRPYTYRPRKTAAEIEAHRLHRALCENLQTGLAPASGAQLTAKGGATGSNFGADFFPHHRRRSLATAPIHRNTQARTNNSTGTRKQGANKCHRM